MQNAQSGVAAAGTKYGEFSFGEKSIMQTMESASISSGFSQCHGFPANPCKLYPVCIVLSYPVFQLGWEKGRVQKKLGTIERANNQNSGTI